MVRPYAPCGGRPPPSGVTCLRPTAPDQYAPSYRVARREVARLADAVEAGETAQVYGPPGIGKTTLLLHATARGALDTAGLEGVLFLQLRGLPVEEVAQEILTGAYDLGFSGCPGRPNAARCCPGYAHWWCSTTWTARRTTSPA